MIGPAIVITEKDWQRQVTQGWLDLLTACDGVEVYVFRPADLDEVAEVLR